jgi:hypothetical protein
MSKCIIRKQKDNNIVSGLCQKKITNPQTINKLILLRILGGVVYYGRIRWMEVLKMPVRNNKSAPLVQEMLSGGCFS